MVATMLLAGIAVNALAGAGTGFLTFMATDAQLRNITFWSLGSLGGTTWTAVSAWPGIGTLRSGFSRRYREPDQQAADGRALARDPAPNRELQPAPGCLRSRWPPRSGWPLFLPIDRP